MHTLFSYCENNIKTSKTKFELKFCGDKSEPELRHFYCRYIAGPPVPLLKSHRRTLGACTVDISPDLRRLYCRYIAGPPAPVL